MRHTHRTPAFLPLPRFSLARDLFRRALLRVGLAALALAAGPALATSYGIPDGPSEEPAWSDSAYTYFRVVEGEATLFPVATGGEPTEPEDVVENQPVLPGDRLTVGAGARLELVLSDGTLLRVGGEAELIFDRIAQSPETEEQATAIRLTTGEIQVVTFDQRAGDPIEIDTPEVQIFLRETGVYRISAGGPLGYGATRVAVREGVAELVTDHGSILVRQDDEASIESGPRARVAFFAAGPEDALESWGRRLFEQATQTESGPVDGSLRYSAASLGRYGSWVQVDGQTAWRPRVEADWRPYWSGRWVYTPSGYLWVSYEPWGWVPYHYGTWALDPGFGWVWFPGSRFAPAWVYWHWGSGHVAWIPIGYYSRHYAHHLYGFGHFGLRHGFYGYAGGPGSFFRHWLFCDLHSFHGRDLHHHARPWDRFGGRNHDRGDFRDRRDVVPRGIVTTDTRGFDRADGPRQRLATPRGDAPDVTAFVAREPRLSQDLERRLVTRDPRPRLAGTPLAPGTPAPRRVTPRTPARTDSAGLGTREPQRLGTVAPRGATPRAESRRPPTSTGREPITPHSTRPQSAGPQSVRPQTAQPQSVRPQSAQPQSVRPQPVRPPSVEPRPERPERVQPRTVRPTSPAPARPAPQTVEPRARTPRATEPTRPTTVRPQTVRPQTVRPQPERPSSVTPRTVRPQSAPRTVSPAPARPATPRSTVPSRPTLQSRPTVQPRPTVQSRPTVQPRPSAGVRRAPSSTPRATPAPPPRATPRSGVSGSTPHGSQDSPQVRSGSGTSGNRSGASRSPSRTPRGQGGSSSGGRRGASRRGGGGH